MRIPKPSIDRLDRGKQHSRRVMVLTMIFLLSYFSAFNRAQADDGDLDKSFGAGGKVVTDFFGGEDEATAAAIQSDGKIIAVGSTVKPVSTANRDFALARYNLDGSLDASFGSGGKVATDFFGRGDFALAVAIQQDGKIVATGKHFKLGSDASSTGFYFATARYHSDGSLDTSFGSGGKVTGDLGQADAIAIQGDGRIVVAGEGFTDGQFPATAFMLARYNSDGSLDTSFAGSGHVITNFFPGSSVISGNNARAVVIQADGKIVAAGSAYNYVARRIEFALARYNGDGSLDASFGGGGKVTTAILDFGSAMALTIRPDGEIVAAGSGGGGPKWSFPGFAIAHYKSDGSLDTSFGSGGTATSEFFPDGSVMRAVSFEPDGEIVAVGSVSMGSKGTDIAVARYNRDGSLDTRFGAGGKVITRLSKSEDDDANAVAIQSDGQIVAVGATDSGVDFALARYNTEQDFGLAFEPSTISAERGTTVSVVFQIARKGGFAGNVTVAHSDMLKIKMKPDSLSTTDTTVTFKLKIKAGAPTGQQQVTFTGKSDSGLERTTTLNLVIQ